jgi:hypothetical protein
MTGCMTSPDNQRQITYVSLHGDVCVRAHVCVCVCVFDRILESLMKTLTQR